MEFDRETNKKISVLSVFSVVNYPFLPYNGPNPGGGILRRDAAS